MLSMERPYISHVTLGKGKNYDILKIGLRSGALFQTCFKFIPLNLKSSLTFCNVGERSAGDGMVTSVNADE